MIKRDSINKVIDVAQVDEVVGEYVNLKRRGANLIGLCPFHNEKTPSFTVSPSKGIYKCFGCGESGNAIGFIMQHENVSFVEAVRQLAAKYNIELEETEQTDEEIKLQDERESLHIACKFAQEYFATTLFDTEDGKNIGLTYFKERGFTQQTIEEFKLGYALNSFEAFYKHAGKNQFSKDILLKTGLVSEKNGKVFDFFRDRVMFTIHDVSGKPVAFAGRTLSSDPKQPKYINSPETAIYVKNRVLYGLFQAKKSIGKLDNCFLVEGYTDVISLHQAGLQNVVASSGTSLTENQVKLLKRFTENITLLFDGDAAGLKAATRGVDIVLEQNVNVKVVMLPEGEDPDSFMKQSGFTAFNEFVDAHKKDFILFKVGQLLGNAGNDPVVRANATKEIAQSIALIPDAIKRAFYIRECATLLSIDEQLLHNSINKIRRKKFKDARRMSERDARLLEEQEEQRVAVQSPLIEDNVVYNLEKELIRLLLEYGHFNITEDKRVSQHILEELDGVELETPEFQEILNCYLHSYDWKNSDDDRPLSEILLKSDRPKIIQTIIDLTSSPYELSENWELKHEIFIETDKEKLFKQDVEDTICRYKLHGAMQLLQLREEELKSEDDVDRQILLLGEITQIKKLVKDYSDSLHLNLPMV